MATKRQPQRIFISAGEASGDLHGANLIRAFKDVTPGIKFYGLGGDHMAAEGFHILQHPDRMALMGASEIIRHLPFISQVFDRCLYVLKHERPDFLVLIDYPGFNFQLGKAAARLGIPVYYYISPQIWAWRKGRVNTMRRFVSQMFVVFPFEVEFYEHSGVPATFVGHPLVKDIEDRLQPNAFRERHKLDPDTTYVTLMPGSRRQELETLLDDILDAASIIRNHRSNVRFLLPMAPSVRTDVLLPGIERRSLPVTLVRGDATNALAVSQAAIVKSGTSTLEAALVRCPAVSLYRVSAMTWCIGKRLVDVPHVVIVNLLAGKTVIPEYLQDDIHPPKIAEDIIARLDQTSARDSVLAEYDALRELLGKNDASKATADAMLRAWADQSNP